MQESARWVDVHMQESSWLVILSVLWININHALLMTKAELSCGKDRIWGGGEDFLFGSIIMSVSLDMVHFLFSLIGWPEMYTFISSLLLLAPAGFFFLCGVLRLAKELKMLEQKFTSIITTSVTFNKKSLQYRYINGYRYYLCYIELKGL